MFEGTVWYEYLDGTVKQLVDLAFYLLDRERLEGSELTDYSFVVFPMAKAYEGFLKKFYLDMGLIDEKAFKSKQFRIGRSLNPALPKKYQDDWYLYDDLTRMCDKYKGKRRQELPIKMWEAWRKGRNKIFHYFPGKEQVLTLEEAGERLNMFVEVMDVALECRGRK